MWTKKCFIIIIRIIIVQENGFIMPSVWLSLDSLTAYSGPFFFNSWHEYSSVKRCWFGNKTGKRISNHHYSKILNVSPDCQLVTAEKSLIFGLREKKIGPTCVDLTVFACTHTHMHTLTCIIRWSLPTLSTPSAYVSICQHMAPSSERLLNRLIQVWCCYGGPDLGQRARKGKG